MKNIYAYLLALAVLFFTACSTDDGGETPEPEPEPEEDVILVESNITEDATWEGDKTYVLTGRIAVEAGATLTIEAGCVVKGEAGTGANASALIIARGAMIMAEGTATAPIIFTSLADDIEPGVIYKEDGIPSTQNGLWGGLIVLGNAPVSVEGGTTAQIEGIPATDPNGSYGGDDVADNSGVLRYISIRHGGSNIGEGNEINGLTLGGVGNGTVIEYVEVVANQDDGIECFGGSVNITNAVVWNAGDDQYDMDQAYTGTITNFISISGANTDHAFELDGPEGTATGSFTLTNGTVKGWSDAGGEYADLRDGVTCTMSNIYFLDFADNSDFELDNDGVAANYLDGGIVLSGLEFNVSHLTSGNMTIDEIFVDNSAAGDAFTTIPSGATIVTSPTVGADASVFSGWTMSGAAGALSGL